MHHIIRRCTDAYRKVVGLQNDRLSTVATPCLDMVGGGDALTAPGKEDHWISGLVSSALHQPMRPLYT